MIVVNDRDIWKCWRCTHKGISLRRSLKIEDHFFRLPRSSAASPSLFMLLKCGSSLDEEFFLRNRLYIPIWHFFFKLSWTLASSADIVYFQEERNKHPEKHTTWSFYCGKVIEKPVSISRVSQHIELVRSLWDKNIIFIVFKLHTIPPSRASLNIRGGYINIGHTVAVLHSLGAILVQRSHDHAPIMPNFYVILIH